MRILAVVFSLVTGMNVFQSSDSWVWGVSAAVGLFVLLTFIGWALDRNAQELPPPARPYPNWPSSYSPIISAVRPAANPSRCASAGH